MRERAIPVFKCLNIFSFKLRYMSIVAPPIPLITQVDSNIHHVSIAQASASDELLGVLTAAVLGRQRSTFEFAARGDGWRGGRICAERRGWKSRVASILWLISGLEDRREGQA